MIESPVASHEPGVLDLSPRQLIRRAGPRMLMEGAGPVLGFYAGYRLQGVVLGVVLATLLSVGTYLLARRSKRHGFLVEISMVMTLLQAAATLATGNPRVYFIQPILTDFAIGIAFGVSVGLRRPIAGAVAKDVFPIPAAAARSPEFHRVFMRICTAWSGYYLLRGGVRTVVLVAGLGITETTVLYAASSTPFTASLMAGSVWYASTRLRHLVGAAPSRAAASG